MLKHLWLWAIKTKSNPNVLDLFSFRHSIHDDVIEWKHFPRYWPFVRGIHRSPVNSPHKGLWRGALMFSLICVWINGWVNNREAGDLRRNRAHHDVIVMTCMSWKCFPVSIYAQVNKFSAISYIDSYPLSRAQYTTYFSILLWQSKVQLENLPKLLGKHGGPMSTIYHIEDTDSNSNSNTNILLDNHEKRLCQNTNI